MINKDRLLGAFLELVRIDSPSRKEAGVLNYLKQRFDELGLPYKTDKVSEKVNSEADNLIAYLKGNQAEAPALMFSAHMDTASPGEGVDPVMDGDKIYSRGDTVLGGDDKSGIAIILEMIRSLKEKNIPHGDLELVFTVCEEIGARGAKYFDTSLVVSKYGFALDGDQVCSAIVNSPSAAIFTATVYGKDSHAGIAPQKGINAIVLASKAISSLPWGKIDDETTCNVGAIESGTASNVIPAVATVKGEVRSLNARMFEKVKSDISAAFQNVVEGVAIEVDGKRFEARVEMVEDEFLPPISVSDDSYTVKLVRKAIEKRGGEFVPKRSLGGSDANYHNGNGIETIVLGTGMSEVHTTDEYILLSDMVACAELCMDIVVENTEM